MNEEAKIAEEQQKSSEDQPRAEERPSEPEPTEFGPETMSKRVEELRQVALAAKIGREAALKAEAEKEKEKEQEAEKETNPETTNNPVAASSKEAEENDEDEEEESSDSTESSSEEETKPETTNNPVGPLSANLDAPQETEGVSEIERDQAATDPNGEYRETIRPCAEKCEEMLSYSASRTMVALFHGTLSGLSEPSDIEPEHLQELQVLGQTNAETYDTLLKGKKRNSQLKLLLIEKEKHLIKQKEELEQDMVRKLNWVQTRMAELKAEETAVERSLAFHGHARRVYSESHGSFEEGSDLEGGGIA